MTIEELKKIPFHFVCHLSMEDEHCTTYISEDKRFGFCDHVPFKDGHPDERRKAYRHYMILGEVYETTENFIEALKNIGPTEVIEGGKYEDIFGKEE